MRTGPVPVLRWSPTVVRKVEFVRDRIMDRCGTSEPLIAPEGEELALLKVTMQWRRPATLIEVNRMAPTPEVRARPGRP
jgi:hypothetical protein